MTPDKRQVPASLDELVREAKDARGPEVDWSKVEAKLFPRVEREVSARTALAGYGGPKRGWVAVGVAMAIAAAVPLFLSHGAQGPSSSFESVSQQDQLSEASGPKAGALTSKERGAVAQVSHEGLLHEVSPGDSIARGDKIDVHGGRATFRRDAAMGSPVTWAVEDGSDVEVRSTRGTLILALEKGAVEAQVAPVAGGEAFAIDVEGARVAVHGTHLRVERQLGQTARVVVDLREGIVSIGLPPKSGATYGDLVTAPAHVEFDPADPHGTLKVTHEVGRVRAALVLERAAEDAPKVTALAPPPANLAPAPAPIPPSPRTAAVSPSPPAPAAVAAPATRATVSPPVPAPPAPVLVDPDPERTIAAQVRTCARDHLERSEGVVITVSSRLELHVGDAGMVTSARFDPPLAPDVLSCAAHAIYGTRFSQPGAVSIPIDFTP